jgi:DNA-directed RNA polymerase specialized sigma subunit
MQKSSKQMTKTEIVESTDFDTLVSFAIKKYKLQNRIYAVDMGLDEVPHMVRAFMWTRKVNTSLALSTIVINFTVWAVKNAMALKFGYEGRRPATQYKQMEEGSESSISDHRESNNFLEAKDLLEKLKKRGYSKEVKIALLFNSKLKWFEVAEKLGLNVSRQRIGQIHDQCIKKLKKATLELAGASYE